MRLRTRASLEMVREWIDTRADDNWRRRGDDLARDFESRWNKKKKKKRNEQIHNLTTHNDSQNALRKRRCVCRVDII